MEKFLLVFRNKVEKNEPPPSPEQLQLLMKPWQEWMGAIAAQDKLVSAGNRLAPAGRVLNADNVITNGPYVETKEAVGGYIIIKASSFDEAVELSKGCPIFQVGGNVEIRMVVPMDY